MAITKLKCPTCGGPAITVSERQIAGMRMVMYKCGHADVQQQMKASDFESFVSADGKKPFKYQVEGALFGVEVANGTFLCCDEMGLGKTVQGIMIVATHRKQMCKSLIVCKAKLKDQWQQEWSRWGGEDFLAQIIEGENDFIMPGMTGLIVSFDLLWRFKDIEGWMAKNKIKTIIMDEVQQIKNSGAKRTTGIQRAARCVKHKIGLSGTPIANHAGEYFTILNILRPDRFRTKSEYEQIWVDTYWNGRTMKYGGLKDPERFKAYTSDFIIRRTRAEVLPDLPTVMRDFRFSPLGETVEAAYRDTLKQFQDDYLYGDAERSAIQKNANIMAYLAKMRHLTGISKIEPTVDFLEDFITETDRKIVVFCHHLDVTAKLHELLKEAQQQDSMKWGGEILRLPKDDPSGTLARFRDSDSRICLASTLAHSEGLNMQFCADCIIMERQWTPIKEEQAEARFPRPGQLADKINATYMIAVGTIDEYLTKIVEQKRQYCSQTLGDKVDYNWDESSIIKELAEVLATTGGTKWGF